MSRYLLLLLAAAVATVGATAEDVESAVPEEPLMDSAAPLFVPTQLSAAFIEQFIQPLGKVWKPSTSKKVMQGIEDETVLQYRGLWAIEESTVYPGFSGDKGLVVKTAAAHHAISAVLPKVVDPTDKTLVVQYEVKLQNGLECGGAYIKLLTYDPDFVADKFTDKSPYTIMFGPDRCGSTNKVHFIFRHKNPVTGEFEEKHLSSPPIAKTDKTSAIYTLVTRPDNSFEILINNESVKQGSLLADFTPAVNPPKEIDDPEDKKPSDWVDVAKISDPAASKPDDWDEDAPALIDDEDAEMPEDWLVNEEANVADPEAAKPTDWDDEEDGDWVAPTVPNPKCKEVSGCGVWVRPKKSNPNYKGKWKAPLIDNPEYKGVWAPRKIPNPNYFEDLHPSNFNKIGAIGIELWTMQDKIMFDNVYIGHSEADAKTFREETWVPKSKLELEVQKKEKPATGSEEKGGSFFEKAKDAVYEFRDRMTDLIRNGFEDPVEAVKSDPLAAGALGLLTIWVLYSFSSLVGMYIGGGTKPPITKAPATESEPKESKEKSTEQKIQSTEKEAGTIKKRAAKKADD